MPARKQAIPQPSLFDVDDGGVTSPSPEVRQSLVVPFGKFKDQPVNLLMAHAEYALWLLSAKGAMLKRSHPQMFAWLVSRFGAPDTTPEHNRLQNRFLDDDFRLQLYLHLEPTVTDGLPGLVDPALAYAGWNKVVESRVHWDYSNSLGDGTPFSSPPIRTKEERWANRKVKALRSLSQDLDRVVTECAGRRDATPEEVREFEARGQAGVTRVWSPVVQTDRPKFEVGGADVEFEAGVHFGIRVSESYITHSNQSQKQTDLVSFNTFKRYRVEVKPFVGDDYPVILRAMVARHCDLLLVEAFEADGASWEQVTKVFASRGIRVAMLEDVLLTPIPECARRLPLPKLDKAAMLAVAQAEVDRYHEQWLVRQQASK